MAGVPGSAPSKPAVAATAATKGVPVETAVDETRESETSAYSEAVTSADHSRGGVAAYNAGDLGKAAEQLQKAVEADPENAESLNNLGQVLVRSGKARDAIAYFDRAIAIAADVWAYRFNRARAYAEMQDWPKAIAGYTDAARMFPGDYVTQFNLAKARQASGDLPGAVEAYGKAAELAPGQADFQLWYGQALEQAGRRQDAVAAYRRFLELEPDAPQAERVKARLARMGQPVTKTPSQAS
jgi:tetratricopeptide (TPR) repeat protein